MIYSTDWLQGYVGDIPYTANFYHHQTPDMLKYCCILNGFDVSHIKEDFTYLELGSGMGFGLNLMAALYSGATFYGIDFNPEHIRFSNKLKKDVGLENVVFFELSFEEFLKHHLDSIPQCDFIVLHGVFSWVSDENRKNIIEIIKTKLKPGGICYISYNNMCGWWTQVPFQRFLLDYSKLFPHLNSINKINNALSMVKKLKSTGSRYFNQKFFENLIKKVEEHNVNYLAHEYLNETWNPLFFTQVLSLATKAKLQYIGSAEPIWTFPELFLRKKQIELLLEHNSYILREILKDYMVNMSFRRDIFMKGGSPIPKGLYEKTVNEIYICSRFSPIDSELKIELPFGNKNANIDSVFLEELLDALKDGPKKIGELKNLPSIKSNKLRELLRNISILIHGRIIDPIFASYENRKITQSLNKIIAKYSRHSNMLKFFGVGQNNNAIAATLFERLVFDAIANNNIKQIDDILKHVKTYATEENLGIKIQEEEIQKRVSECINNSLTRWKNLRILEDEL